MEVFYHRRFRKQYCKLPIKNRKKVKATIKAFQRNPHNPTLRNHPLKGNHYGERAISVTGDTRIVFIKERNYQRVTLLRVGSHAQVYK